MVTYQADNPNPDMCVFIFLASPYFLFLSSEAKCEQ